MCHIQGLKFDWFCFLKQRNKSKSLNDLEKQVKQDEPVKPVCPGGIQLERVELLKADQTDEVKQPLLR